MIQKLNYGSKECFIFKILHDAPNVQNYNKNP